MITCPNCNHQNPDGALQCEACYTPLPALATCPNCQATVQADASFCGQCGNDLRASSESASAPTQASAPEPAPEAATESFSEFSQSVDFDESVDFGDFEAAAEPTLEFSGPATASGVEANSEIETEPENIEVASVESSASAPSEPAASSLTPSSPESAPPTPAPPTPTPTVAATTIQAPSATLRHVQTQTSIAVPSQLSVVRIGKPNDHTPPDIDVSGLPESEIVSRVHANLLLEDDVYYLEDMGSSNGTYINGLPLPSGNRHRLHAGDRIALGKGDKVSFIFEVARY